MKYLWTTIHVKDMAASLRFWQEALGLPIHHRINPNPQMDIVFLGEEGETLVELLYDARAREHRSGDGVSLGFQVESLDAWMAALAERGVAVESGPHQPNPRMRFIYVRDPDGAVVQFVESR